MRQLCLELAGWMLHLGGVSATVAEGKKQSEKLIASEKTRVSTGTSGIDHSRTIDALKREIASQQEEIKRLRSQVPASPDGANRADSVTSPSIWMLR